MFAGRAGSGFSDKQLADVRRELESHARDDASLHRVRPRIAEATTWVDPVMVAEVEFTERTEDGLLRQPVFLRFRDDKAAGGVQFARSPGPASGGSRPAGPSPSRGPAVPARPRPRTRAG